MILFNNVNFMLSTSVENVQLSIIVTSQIRNTIIIQSSHENYIEIHMLTKQTII